MIIFGGKTVKLPAAKLIMISIINHVFLLILPDFGDDFFQSSPSSPTARAQKQRLLREQQLPPSHRAGRLQVTSNRGTPGAPNRTSAMAGRRREDSGHGISMDPGLPLVGKYPIDQWIKMEWISMEMWLIWSIEYLVGYQWTFGKMWSIFQIQNIPTMSKYPCCKWNGKWCPIELQDNIPSSPNYMNRIKSLT